MESKIIYISNETYLPKVNWKRLDNAESEWKYLDINKNSLSEIQSLINAYFDDAELLIVTTRNDSRREKRNDIGPLLLDILDKFNFTIWNVHFKKVIEFNNVGVYRYGERACQ